MLIYLPCGKKVEFLIKNCKHIFPSFNTFPEYLNRVSFIFTAKSLFVTCQDFRNPVFDFWCNKPSYLTIILTLYDNMFFEHCGTG